MMVFNLMFDLSCFIVFFFKQKTAYEMRISDWSSDVCSSDLNRPTHEVLFGNDKDIAAEYERGFVGMTEVDCPLQVLHETRTKLRQELPRRLSRSAERRVGKARVSTCRYRWSPYH